MGQTVESGVEQQLSLLSGQDFWRTRGIPSENVPAILLADGPHGLRVQREGGDHLGLNSSQPATCFPPAVTLASSWNIDLIREVGEAVGREATALGVGVVLGPGLNIKRHPLCGRNFEYYSEDPLISGLMAAAAVNGIQSTGVGACLKHFAVNNQEHLRFVTDAIVDERTRRELYLKGFELAVRQSRPRAVMAAYNRVNGVHCADDRALLTGTLRTEWGFDGIVVSDWGAEVDRVAGINAGMDLDMPGGFDRTGELRDAIATGKLSLEAVAASAQRIKDLARSLPAKSGDLIELASAHDQLARRAAAESAVVLANDGILPLARDQRLAVIGAFAEEPRYQGSGSSLVAPITLTTLLDAFREEGINVRYAAGYDPKRSAADPALIAEAAETAAKADIAVVMVGLPGLYESEGFDRTTLSLPAQHDALVRAVAAANPRTVVVLSNGAPVLMPWIADVSAVLECYLGGQASGGAAVDALLGAVEPSGRLAETFPLTQKDVAADKNFPGSGKQVEYREGIFVGYRYAATAQIAPLFPFGHGLGYGTTRWTNPSLDQDVIVVGGSITVCVDVENIGDRATSDVVQIYARDLTGIVLRPHRELVGFAKVSLQPGEKRSVPILISSRDLSFWDVLTGSWRLPTGTFELEVARSSSNIEAFLALSAQGDATESAEPPSAGLIATSDTAFAQRLGHPIPVPTPTRPFSRQSTVEEISATLPGRILRAVMRKATNLPEETLNDPVTMAMIERSTGEMPLRGIVQFSGGKLPWSVVDTIIDMANGRPFEPVRRLIRSRRKA